MGRIGAILDIRDIPTVGSNCRLGDVAVCELLQRIFAQLWGPRPAAFAFLFDADAQRCCLESDATTATKGLGLPMGPASNFSRTCRDVFFQRLLQSDLWPFVARWNCPSPRTSHSRLVALVATV